MILAMFTPSLNLKIHTGKHLQNQSTSTQIRADPYMAPGTPTMDGCPATPPGAGPGTPGMLGSHGTPEGKPQTDLFIVDKTHIQFTNKTSVHTKL